MFWYPIHVFSQNMCCHPAFPLWLPPFQKVKNCEYFDTLHFWQFDVGKRFGYMWSFCLSRTGFQTLIFFLPLPFSRRLAINWPVGNTLFTTTYIAHELHDCSSCIFILRQFSEWAPVLQPKTSKTLFRPLNTNFHCEDCWQSRDLIKVSKTFNFFMPFMRI